MRWLKKKAASYIDSRFRITQISHVTHSHMYSPKHPKSVLVFTHRSIGDASIHPSLPAAQWMEMAATLTMTPQPPDTTFTAKVTSVRLGLTNRQLSAVMALAQTSQDHPHITHSMKRWTA